MQKKTTESKSKTIRAILADDHIVIRQGLRALIERTEDIVLVGECGDGVSARERIRLHNPDVAILDIAMPLMDGLTLAERLIKDNCRSSIIILTTHDDPLLLQQSASLGISHYISKMHAFEILLETIRLAAGDAVRSVTQLNRPDINDVPSFKITVRERQILKLVANGMTNRMISEHLEISIKTVDRHRTNLMSKLGLHTAAQLSRFAHQIGLS